MTISATLRINMTGLDPDPARESERYRAALDMVSWAEDQGFSTVNFEEHHCADNGWLPAPLTMAAMAIGRTRRIRVSVSALLVTLYDPVRLAEDIAVLDLASGGRFTFVAGLGYRPLEYAAMGRDWTQRGAQMDETLETLLAAWSGEPFVHRGRTLRVTPVPVTRPHPFFLIGGMSRPAARRAARLGLPFCPPQHDPSLEAYYHEQLEAHGRQGFVYPLGEGNTMLYIEPDPEAAWPELAPYFLREIEEYQSWKVEGVPRPKEEPVHTLEDLRAQKRFEILSPDAARSRLESAKEATLVLHPLAGGIPLERAWRGLERFADEVWAPLRRNGAA